MDVPSEVYGLIAWYLWRTPRARSRLAQVCRAAHIGVNGGSPVDVNELPISVHIAYYKEHVEVHLPISVGSRDAAKSLDYNGKRYCDVIVGDICIRVWRYNDCCLVRMFKNNRCFHHYTIDRSTSDRKYATELINLAAPGVIM